MAKKKKKGKKLNPQTNEAQVEKLAAALESGQADDLDPGAIAGIEAVAFDQAFEKGRELAQRGPDPRAIIELPAAFQLAFLKLAADEEDDDLIGDLLEMTADRQVRKEAKRILHRLRSRGVAVDVPTSGGGSVLDRAVTEEEKPLPCYLSPVSATGRRMVLLARYTRGGVAVHQAEWSDTEGLADFNGGVLGRNRYRQMHQEMDTDEGGLFEIGYGEARVWLARAAELRRQAEKPLPDGYLEASGELGAVDESATPPDPKTLFPPDAFEDRDALAARGAELLEEPEFADWLPDPETLQSIDEKIKEVESSQLAINDQQRIEQVQKAIDDGVVRLLDDEDKRNRFFDRLLQNAAYLQRNGGREEPARLAAAAGWQLLDEDFEPLASPLFSQIVKRIFRSAEDIVAAMDKPQGSGAPPKPEPEGGSGLIVP